MTVFSKLMNTTHNTPKIATSTPSHLELRSPLTGQTERFSSELAQNEAVATAGSMEPDPPTVQSCPKHAHSYRLTFGKLTELLNRAVLEVEVIHSSGYDFKQPQECFLTLLELYALYGFNPEEHEDSVMISAITKSIIFFLTYGTHWIKYFKYRIAVFFSAWNDQELPTAPYEPLPGDNPKYLFGGPFYGFLKRLERQGRMMSFSTSILMSKKGMPRADDDLVRQAEIDNYNAMTDPAHLWAGVPSVVTEVQRRWENQKSKGLETRQIVFDSQKCESEIRRSVREIFGDWKFSLDQQSEPYFPSTSSNYNRTRSKMGTYGELNELPRWKTFIEEVQAQGGLSYTLTETLLTDYVSEYFGEKGREDSLDHINDDKIAIGLGVSTEFFVSAFRKFYFHCVNQALVEEPLVEVVGLKEALKIRCISKGPPLTYFVLKPLQRSLWKHMQKYKVFKLTGTPITEEFIEAEFNKFVEQGFRLHSGDYSAATDGLRSECSNIAVDELRSVYEENMGYKNDPLFELCKRALTGHVYVDGEQKAQQTIGQLMGSIVSFVFLCILNFTLMRHTLEVSQGKTYSVKSFPGLVNGDDCLTPYQDFTEVKPNGYVGPSFPSYWEECAKVFGFAKSVGKTYDSPIFCSMNSTTFCVRDNRLRMVDYVNLGLLHGQKRSESESEGVTPHDLGVLHQKLMQTCPEGLEIPLTQLFIERHKVVLNSFKGPWFLPIWMGGLGLSQQEAYSKEDRFYAFHALMEAASGTKTPSRTLDKEWMHYDLYEQVVICKGHGIVSRYNFETYGGEETYGRAFTAIVYVEGWINKGLKSLYNPNTTQDTRCVRECIAFFRKVQNRCDKARKAGLYQQADLEVFEAERKESVLPVFVTD